MGTSPGREPICLSLPRYRRASDLGSRVLEMSRQVPIWAELSRFPPGKGDSQRVDDHVQLVPSGESRAVSSSSVDTEHVWTPLQCSCLWLQAPTQQAWNFVDSGLARPGSTAASGLRWAEGVVWGTLGSGISLHPSIQDKAAVMGAGGVLVERGGCGKGPVWV